MGRKPAGAGIVAAAACVLALGAWATGLWTDGARAQAQSGDGALGRDVLLSRFDGRDYLLVWPSETPTGVLIMLHDIQTRAFAIEARDGLIDSAADFTERSHLALLIPSAAHGGCEGETDDAAADVRDELVFAASDMLCWRLGDGAADDVRYLRRLTASVARARAVAFDELQLVGYGRGGDFVIEALRQGQLAAYAKLGVIAGARSGEIGRAHV